MLDELSHTNILKTIDFKFNAIDVEPNGTAKQIAYLVMELAEGGGLFDKINIDGPFSEQICRYYFKQMI
jgi:serine/threonine protein kinase